MPHVRTPRVSVQGTALLPVCVRFSVRTAQSCRGVLGSSRTTEYCPKPTQQVRLHSPGTAQPRSAKTPDVASLCRAAKLQTRLTPAKRFVPASARAKSALEQWQVLCRELPLTLLDVLAHSHALQR